MIFLILWGRKFVGKSLIKTFRASLGTSGKNPSHPQKFACSYTYAYYFMFSDFSMFADEISRRE